jgi:hypothetical protein
MTIRIVAVSQGCPQRKEAMPVRLGWRLAAAQVGFTRLNAEIVMDRDEASWSGLIGFRIVMIALIAKI